MRAAFLCALWCASPGCANYAVYGLKISSNAAKVKVVEEGKMIGFGHDPLVMLEVNRDHDLIVSTEGSDPRVVHLESHVSGSRVTLVIVGSLLLPIIVVPLIFVKDMWHVLEPEEPRVDFAKDREPGSTSDGPVLQAAEKKLAAPSPSPESSEKKFCTSCGAKRESTAAYCPNCGAKQ